MTQSIFVKYASIVLDVSINKTLDYGVTEEQAPLLKRGMRVEVPVRGRLQRGYVYALKDQPEVPKVQPIARIVSDQELVTEDLFNLGLWISRYYCAPLNQVFKMLLPAIVRKDAKHKEQLYVMRLKSKEDIQAYCKQLRNKNSSQADVLDAMLKVKKGILLTELLEITGGSRSPVETLAKNGYLKVDIVRVDRSPLVDEDYFRTKSKTLNHDQTVALERINQAIVSKKFEAHLLFGVTGSGKTEVYLQAIEKALALGKGTIMLVPEIALTAQTIERFRSRFEGHIAILHHRLSEGERFDEWHKIRRGDAKIVIGARSAIFSPVPNLGLIIVDEEHENSYKQSEEAPCYHARDVAVMRGKMGNAVVVLGSATPSLESYQNALSGKYVLSKLTNRADAASLPKVTIINMKTEYERSGGYTNFSSNLLTGIKKRIATGEQTILFLNRRGYHTTLFCQTCQDPIKCRHCDVGLTFHLNDNTLACHLCGFTLSPPPKACPTCKGTETMKYKGVGTEQIQRSLHAIFPDVRTLRMDADTTKHKGSHQKLFREFGSGKADILIGTQMIAKGLHFPQVTLVGVLNSDTSLNIPDFRAAENVFQLITQVSGRAGRGALKGEVIIQTLMPDNSTIQHASKQDYEAFFKEEMETRQLFNYPPYASLAKIAFTGADEKKTYTCAELTRNRLSLLLPSEYELNAVLPSGYAKVKDKFRFQFLVRGQTVYPIARALDTLKQEMRFPGDIKMFIDINPTSTLF